MRCPASVICAAFAACLGLLACDDSAVGPGTSQPDADAADTATPGDPDRVDATCQEPSWSAGACVAGAIEARPATEPPLHVALPTPISYAESPPASGPHRGTWARWGEYAFLPPQRWVHNLEHGGVALLYHPCAPAAVVDALREWARSQPADDGGELRWVLTPYPGLASAVALVAWEQVYAAECVRPDELDAFLHQHYRKAPEDVAVDGPYETTWLGR